MACTWPNEPVGFALPSAGADKQFAWQGVANVTTNEWLMVDRGEVAALVTDPESQSAPCDGSGKAWSGHYPVGWPVGFAPYKALYTIPTPISSGQIYLGFWFMYSPGWISEPFDKMVLVHSTNYNSTIYSETTSETHLSDASNKVAFFAFNSPAIPSSNRFPNISGATMASGVWHQKEMLLSIDSPRRFRWWIDNVLIGDYADIGEAIDPSFPFDTVEIFPDWGGNIPGQTVPQDQHFYISHLRFSTSSGGTDITSPSVTITGPTSNTTYITRTTPL